MKGRFEVDLTRGDQKIHLEIRKQLEVSKGSGHGIPLSSGELTSLFFGVGKPTREIPALAGQSALLDLLFPLEWYWWRSDWI